MMMDEVVTPLISEPVCELEAQHHVNGLCAEFALLQKEKGWPERSFGEEIALFHSEASEAFEDYRNGRGLKELYFKQQPDGSIKPEGIPIELADIAIRVMAFCGLHGIDLASAMKRKHEYNKTRPVRHGGKVI